MKKFLILIALVSLSLSTFAQRNPDIRYLGTKKPEHRREFILPQVNGFNIYKADLHVHTVYSDGMLSGRGRVEEAYSDGLDIIAITDHIEYRPNEGKFLKATQGYHPEPPTVKKDRSASRVDLNVPFQDAYKPGQRLGIMVIPGVEITRHPDKVGHYNALFIKDANTIYHKDAEQSIRNAKAQGALIMHNHPGWRRKTVDKNEFHEKIYREGLIDGVELVNGGSFGAKLIKRCIDEKLFMAAATDIHKTSAQYFAYRDYFRTCTFILSKKFTEDAIKDALVKDRTLAYAYDNIIGAEKLLKSYFEAAVTMKVIYTSSKGDKTVALTNMTSIPYQIRRGKKGAGIALDPFHTITFKVAKDKDLGFTVLNLWTADEEHPNGKHLYYKYKLAK